MKLPLTREAALWFVAELEARLLKYPESSYRLHRLGQADRLTRAVAWIDGGQPPAQKALFSRLLGFVLTSYIKLPKDAGRVVQAVEELDELGFEMVNLAASGVFEPEITGADFR